jgi:hypothetical protein
MMLDPLVTSIISISFGLMFLLASVHKLTGFAQFRAVLHDYRVMPGAVVPLVAAALPVLEILLGLGWLFLADVRIAAFATIGLVALYSSTIAINLLRGRVHISCGCGFGKAAGGDETLSWGLVVRNAALLAAAVTATLPEASRSLGVLDYTTLLAALVAIVLLFTAGNQLIRNSGAINAWRRGVRPSD